MTEERSLAKQLGYEDPINSDIQTTHQCYNQNMKRIFESLGNDDEVPKNFLIWLLIK